MRIMRKVITPLHRQSIRTLPRSDVLHVARIIKEKKPAAVLENNLFFS
jgi:hypothetical protein